MLVLVLVVLVVVVVFSSFTLAHSKCRETKAIGNTAQMGVR